MDKRIGFKLFLFNIISNLKQVGFKVKISFEIKWGEEPTNFVINHKKGSERSRWRDMINKIF